MWLVVTDGHSSVVSMVKSDKVQKLSVAWPMHTSTTNIANTLIDTTWRTSSLPPIYKSTHLHHIRRKRDP
jgi:hypothetical protein